MRKRLRDLEKLIRDAEHERVQKKLPRGMESGPAFERLRAALETDDQTFSRQLRWQHSRLLQAVREFTKLLLATVGLGTASSAHADPAHRFRPRIVGAVGVVAAITCAYLILRDSTATEFPMASTTTTDELPRPRSVSLIAPRSTPDRPTVDGPRLGRRVHAKESEMNHRTLAPALLAVAAASSAPSAQLNWNQRNLPTNPPPRGRGAAAYDIARSQTVMFGGTDNQVGGGTRLADTWLFDGQNWARADPKNAPSRRGDHAMAYDALRRVVVLFGGFSGNTRVGDTWEWDGADWHQRTGSLSPSPRDGATMVYDHARRVCVLFGGNDLDNNARNDTWLWNGVRWQQVTSHGAPGNPAPRTSAGMAYDSRRDRVTLFGGLTRSQGGSELGDTWEWDGTAWARQTPANSPPSRFGHMMVYDAFRGATVLFGGTENSSRSMHLDTWEWDGSNWFCMSTALSGASPSWRGAYAYDANRQCSVLFGGLTARTGQSISAATREFRSVEQVGQGCLASRSLTPRLSPVAGPSLVIGTDFTLALREVPPLAQSQPLLLFGTPLQQPRPLWLAPRCKLTTTARGFTPMQRRQQGWVARVPIPNLPTLIGQSVGFQGLVPTAPGNRLLPVSLSNGVNALIGK